MFSVFIDADADYAFRFISLPRAPPPRAMMFSPKSFRRQAASLTLLRFQFSSILSIFSFSSIDFD